MATIADASSYAQRYALMPDVTGGNPLALLAPFSAESNEQPATLRERVLAAPQDTPKVFVFLTDEISPKIRYIHRTTKFQASLGATSNWDNHSFGFNSDVGEGNQIGLVVFPAADAFLRSLMNTVPATAAAMDQAWTANAGGDCLGPYAAGDADTHDRRARFFMPVPHAYVNHVMRRTAHTPEQFWREVIGQIRADNNVASCQPLIDWAIVSSVYQAGVNAGAPNAPATAIDPLPAPTTDEILRARTWSWLSADLPALATRTGTVAMAVTDVVRELRADFADRRREDAAARITAAAPKTFSTKYPEACDGLLRLCEVANDAALPSFWRTFAVLTKREGLFHLNQSLQVRASQPDSGGSAPVATPELWERISNFRFGSIDVDDLKGGLSPFLICSGINREAAMGRDRATVYEMLHSGGGSATLDQLYTLASTAPAFPHSLLGLNVSLNSYSVLLDVLLGIHHRVCLAYRAFLTSWSSRLLEVENSFPGNVSSIIPLILRYVQLTMINYFNEAPLRGAGTELPPLSGLINIINFRNWNNLPLLPPTYMMPQQPNDQGAGQQPAPAGRAPPAQGPVIAPPPPVNRRVVNAAPNIELQTLFGAAGIPLRQLTNNDAAGANPQSGDGSGQLCLSWILRGSCNTDCRRAATHRPFTPAEVTSVRQYVQRGLA